MSRGQRKLREPRSAEVEPGLNPPSGGRRALELMSWSRTSSGGRENFGACFRHQDRMLELSGEFFVGRQDGPAVRFGRTGIRRPFIDHRFDRKAHPRRESLALALARGHVGDIGTLVELASNSVTDILVDDSKTVLGRFIHDHGSDSSHGAIGFDRFDCQVKRVKGALGHLTSGF